MREMMMTQMAVLRDVCVCLEVTGALTGECRMTLEAEVPNKKGWVERTEAAKSSVDIDRGG